MRYAESLVGRIRRRWVFENLMLDDEEEQKQRIAYLELLATYVAPDNMRQILDHRRFTDGIEGEEDQGGTERQPEGVVQVMRVGGVEIVKTNPAFVRKMRDVKRGTLAPGPDNPKIPALRKELKAQGIPIYSMEDYYRRLGIDPEQEVLPDGEGGA